VSQPLRIADIDGLCAVKAMAEAGMESFRESYHKFTGMLHCVHKCNAYEWSK
jgi:hypothetical protein